MDMQTEITEGFSLSPQQRRLWSVAAGATARAYRAQGCILVEGPLCLETLLEALRAVVERHEILRTTFRRLPEMTIPVQVIGEGGFSFDGPHSLLELDESRQAAAVDALFRDDGRRPYEAGSESPLRATLLTLAPQKHLLFVSLPALCADAVTLAKLTREIGRAYAGRYDEADDEPMQYADLAEWQNGILEAEYSTPGKEYWHQQDLEALLDLRLPLEREPTEATDVEPESLTFTVDPEMRAAVERLAREHDATPADLLLACWHALLWRHTRRPEVGVGVLFAGRNYQELEEALGPFARYLPVVCRLSKETRFDEALAQVVRATRAADKWQECFSWEQLAKISDDERSPAFFPFCFDYEQEAEAEDAGPLRLTLLRRLVRLDRARLTLSCSASALALRISLRFDPARLSRAAAAALFDQFRTLLRSALSEPSAPLASLHTLGPEAAARLLARAAPARLPEAEAVCLHHLFERHAAAHPDRTALVCEPERLSYGELNAAADRVARLLRGLGVGPEVTVGLMLGRTASAVVGLLGVLKAGGAYLPLEEGHPAGRVRGMLWDAGARVVVTSEALRPVAEAVISGPAEGGGSRQGEWARPHLLVLDGAETRAESASLPGSDLGGDEGGGLSAQNLAYVIFTSGSTGRPKGVGVEHRQITHYVGAARERLGLAEGASYASVSTLAADLGHTALFPALCGGGTLHLISREEAGEAGALASYFGRHRVDCLKVVPTHLRALLGAGGGAGVLPRERLVLGGEASTWGLVGEVRRVAPRVSVLNHYGPTEATVGALSFEVGGGGAEGEAEAGADGAGGGVVPLGYPLGRVRAYVLDGRMGLLAAGETGELYLGGAGVARGYVGDAGQTAERFVPDPFGAEPGGRLYRTGDVCRYGACGAVEYVGRGDGQVKVRGYRVELGEVEAAVLGHAGVRECAVAAREGVAGGGAGLVCYYVAAGGGEGVSAEGLREWASVRLPEYMVPGAWVEVGEMPRTPNGKLDRRALPAPEDARPKTEYVPPHDETESVLVSVWESVLGVSPIGIHDDYFALGGDSIRVIQIVSEAAKYDLPVTALEVLQYPTVHKLAHHLRAGKASAERERVPLELARLPPHVVAQLPEEFEDAYPLARMQEFVIRHYAEDGQGAGVYHIQHSYHVYDAELSPKEFKRALALLVGKHPALRTVFFLHEGGHPFQAVKKQVACAVEEDDISHLSAGEQDEYVEAAMRRDRREPFDVSRTDQPPFRFKLFIRSARTFEFCMSIHHAVTDGWGDRELTNELVALYAALKRGEVAEPGRAVNSYKEFVALEREMIASKEARDFWREHLRGHSHTPPTPAAREAADAPDVTGYSYVLDSELAARLQSLSRERRVSLKAVFLSAYLDLIGAQTRAGAVTVGVVSNGRSERLSAPLKSLGLFWNIVPFNCALAADKLAQLGEVQQDLIRVEQFARYPLAQILDDHARPELFFATLNFLHFHNLKEISSKSGLKLLGMKGHDKFHFPLNYVVSVNPFSGTIGFRVEYDRRYFDEAAVRQMTADFIELLSGLARLRAEESEAGATA